MLIWDVVVRDEFSALPPRGQDRKRVGCQKDRMQTNAKLELLLCLDRVNGKQEIVRRLSLFRRALDRIVSLMRSPR